MCQFCSVMQDCVYWCVCTVLCYRLSCVRATSRVHLQSALRQRKCVQQSYSRHEWSFLQQALGRSATVLQSLDSHLQPHPLAQQHITEFSFTYGVQELKKVILVFILSYKSQETLLNMSTLVIQYNMKYEAGTKAEMYHIQFCSTKSFVSIIPPLTAPPTGNF